MSELIFHHYEPSPFAEKIRSIFGYKDIEWKSVQIPRMMPKPDVMPLTGGYRKTPVLQIGAHIYCDTQIIIREIEARKPTPSLFPDGSDFLGWGTSFFTDKALFSVCVAIVFGSFGDQLPDEFIKDRAELSGGNINIERMKAGLPFSFQQFSSMLDWAEQGLADERTYFLGDVASLVDFNMYFNLWFAGRVPDAKAIIAQFPNLSAWMARVADFGHGRQSDMTSKEALQIAKKQDVSAFVGEIQSTEGLGEGEQVTITPNDSGRIPVTGNLVTLTTQEVAIRHTNDIVGEVIIHFPRAGFILS
ncbi:glutathione S-transferase family protein [Sneathiella marina]|uniref:Glutathione S-transferase family protein n=1 Tax=Sneathiella marina TaxID=2950108 RepID=A0ABY4W8S5_9PROT|nr:glutathione S-transferase family protein [Sneathiella marina]USG62327.1 glutathione S-transferase family protein [Sneathiella marina]